LQQQQQQQQQQQHAGGQQANQVRRPVKKRFKLPMHLHYLPFTLVVNRWKGS
jgi:hypothetical protein